MIFNVFLDFMEGTNVSNTLLYTRELYTATCTCSVRDIRKAELSGVQCICEKSMTVHLSSAVGPKLSHCVAEKVWTRTLP